MIANDSRREIRIADLTGFQPRTAISRKLQRYAWRAVDYEVDDGTEPFAGVMLLAWPESEVPDIRYSPGVEGWYAIYLGLWSGEGIRIRLSGDGAAQWVAADMAGRAPAQLQEVFWRSEDVTGRDLIVQHPEGGYPCESSIAYIRLVPLSAAEVGHIRRDRARTDTRRLIAMNDMHGLFYTDRPVNPEQLHAYIEPYRNSDFDKLFLEYWESEANSHSIQGGMLCSAENNLFFRQGDRNVVESREILKSKGVDIYQSMIAYARQIGLKVYLSQRANAWVSEPPYDASFTSDFYRNHPEWRCVDRDGSEIARMSYAFPEVQERIISMYQTMASYGPDGISMLYNRHFPYLLYEEPLIAGFIAKEGVDPRELDEQDDRWLSYRATIITGFMRKLKLVMSASAKEAGKDKINISVHVLAHERENRFWGLDVEAWAAEGLVDEVVAHPRVMLAPNVKSSSATNVVPVDVGYYARIIKGTPCKLYIDMLPRQMSPEEYRQRAAEYYRQGADGLCFWDTTTRYLRTWSMMSRLGHRHDLAGWEDGEGQLYRTVPLKSLGGCRVDRYPPSWGL